MLLGFSPLALDALAEPPVLLEGGVVIIPVTGEPRLFSGGVYQDGFKSAGAYQDGFKQGGVEVEE